MPRNPHLRRGRLIGVHDVVCFGFPPQGGQDLCRSGTPPNPLGMRQAGDTLVPPVDRDVDRWLRVFQGGTPTGRIAEIPIVPLLPDSLKIAGLCSARALLISVVMAPAGASTTSFRESRTPAESRVASRSGRVIVRTPPGQVRPRSRSRLGTRTIRKYRRIDRRPGGRTDRGVYFPICPVSLSSEEMDELPRGGRPCGPFSPSAARGQPMNGGLCAGQARGSHPPIRRGLPGRGGSLGSDRSRGRRPRPGDSGANAGLT